MVVREILTRWGFQVDDKQVVAANKRINGMIQNIGTYIKAYLGYRAVRAMFDLAKGAGEYANELSRNAEMLGITTDSFQELAYATRMGDVSQENFMMGMRKMSMTLQDLASGQKDATSKYQELGVTQEEAASGNLKLDKLMLRVADRFKAMANGAKKTDLAVYLFGRSGMKLIPFLNKGSEGLKSMFENAHKLGYILDDQTIKQGERFENVLKKWGYWFKVLKVRMGIELAPYFEKLFERGIPAAIEIVKSLWSTIDGVVKALGGWANVLTAIGIYIVAINWPIVLITLGLLALIDVIGALQGKASIFEDLFGKDTVEILKDAFKWLEKVRLVLVDLTAIGIEWIVKGFSFLTKLGGAIGVDIAEGVANLKAFHSGTTPSTAPIAPVPVAGKKSVTVNQTNNIKSTDPKQASKEMAEATKNIWEQFSFETQ